VLTARIMDAAGHLEGVRDHYQERECPSADIDLVVDRQREGSESGSMLVAPRWWRAAAGPGGEVEIFNDHEAILRAAMISIPTSP